MKGRLRGARLIVNTVLLSLLCAVTGGEKRAAGASLDRSQPDFQLRLGADGRVTEVEIIGLSTAELLAVEKLSTKGRDAIFNVSRSALLIAALIQSPELLLAATEDKLHQRYRAEAMPETDLLILTLRAAGQPAVVSGAGPSILVLASDPSERADAARIVEASAETAWQALQLAVDFLGATVQAADGE